ncbi:peptide ABC transporter substrate-binding protein [Clostridium sp. KNHs214]|uniref:peptide ABC transporter substrate-binding protein n=1 Tax=Clostridium sp. KNHs214 TaxID=1540257 RepID=UPI0005514FC7|nr:peptide ABC transporter substrate-binding protein [Clostridium sp. KNHs214]
MKSKKMLALLVTASVVASTALIGCGSGSKDSASGSKMDKEQYLNLVLQAEPKTLDPSKGSDTYSSVVLTQVMEGLTRIEQDENGKDVIKPAGAEKWEHNENGTEWTFHLRDYQWSDGKKVTAKDYEYGIKRTLDPKTGSTYAFLLSPIKNADEFNKGKAAADTVGVKAVDDKTLKITLKQPCAYFVDLTYFKVMHPQRQDIIEKAGEKYGSEANTMVFCGPFTIKEWTHQNQVVLEKNDKYWDKDKVKLSKATYKIIKDQNAMYNSLYNGELDSAGVSKPEWIKKFDATGKFQNIKGYVPTTNYTFFNTKDKLFSNTNVRKAFSLAITREDMANVIFHGVAEAAYGWCPPSLQIGGKEFREAVGEQPIKKLAAENKDPKELLVKGLKELGMDPDPTKLSVKVLESGTSQWQRTYAEYEQQMFKKVLGVNVKAEYAEWPVFQKRTDELDYQIAGAAWTGDYNDPNTFFDMWVTGAGVVQNGWSNKKYDDLIKKAQATMDEKQRLEAYKEAEKILLSDEAVIAPTIYQRRNTYRAKYVKNLMSPLFGTGDIKYAYTEGRNK